MSSTTNTNQDEAISQFCAVTGADEDRAKGLLEACNWDLELAINMQVDTDDGSRRLPSSSSATNTTAALGPSTSSASAVPVVTVQESDDDVHVDNVRPPIAPVRQVLVQNSGVRRYNTRTGNMSSDVYDPFRDFQAEAQWQEMSQHEQGESSSANGNSDSTTSAATIAANATKRTLQELFRPPLELMYRGSLEMARETGSNQNKWLLVNVQKAKEFQCQTLNRDVWSHQTVKDILREHFIFWQVYHDSFEGTRYVQFYNVSGYPHVSIIDPRTGEQMKSWPTSIDHNSFCDSVVEFLTEHPSPDGSSDVNTMKKLRVKEELEPDAAVTLYDQSEEAQLEAAIRASLRETENSNSSSKAYLDEDSYTDAIDSDNDSSQLAPQVQQSQKLQQKQQLKQELVTPKQEVVIEDYRNYLGKDTEKFADLVVRFPDGTRDQFKFPSDSLMKALFLLLTSRGFGMNQYIYVTNFPRRPLHELPDTDTLHDAKLIRETIFVERKPNDD